MEVLSMNKGNGETSYAKNSSVQSKIISIGKPVMEEAIVEMLCRTNIPESIGMADLGCSSGPNALKVISDVLEIIYTKCQEIGNQKPEFRVYLNDLPWNDFNSIFELLPKFYNKLKEEKGSGIGSCYISGMPGSFYGRLFPSQSLHCVLSFCSLHWLSQVPLMGMERNMNKGKIYISKSSSESVVAAYKQQFQIDFSLFLKSRAHELVLGGSMILSFMGRRSSDPTTDQSCNYQWELLARALMILVCEGLVEQEKVDSFNLPYYAPCGEEMKCEVKKNGCFIINQIEAFEIDWDPNPDDNGSTGERVAKSMRVVVESMLEAHFGRDIMDYLFIRYAELMDDYLSNDKAKNINFVISMFRNDN